MNTGEMWPVYGGKSFDVWNPDTGNYYAWAEPQLLRNHLHEKRLSQSQFSSSAFHSFDSDWLSDPETLLCLHPRIAFRNTTNPTNRRTTVVCLIPPNVFIVNSAPYLLFPPGHAGEEAYVLGVLSSIPFDWCSRRVVELSLNFHIFNSLPIPRPPEDDPLRNHVIHLAGRLAAVDDRYGNWAEQVGVEVASVKTEREKADLIAELDAAVALLYGLDESDIQVIYDTFHKTIDHLPDINAVLGHHRDLQ